MEFLLPDVEDPRLFNLLNEWGLDILYTTLIEHEVSYEQLHQLTETDISDLIPLIGRRANFRTILLQWRNEELYVGMTKQISASSSLNINQLLQETVTGQDILAKYCHRNVLEKCDRTEVVRIIVDALLLGEKKGALRQ